MSALHVLIKTNDEVACRRDVGEMSVTRADVVYPQPFLDRSVFVGVCL